MANNTIIKKGTGIRKERTANAAITPGHLVEVMSTGKLRVHATAGSHAQKAFAVENDLIGDGITTAYAAAAQVQYEVMERGSEVYALLANGQNVAIGAPLESAGDGTLRAYTHDSNGLDTTNNIIGYALDAVDMSDSSAADPSGRITVEIA
ncbi:MAG: hypothetical protein ACYC36_16190 [Bellilinea sp.]